MKRLLEPQHPKLSKLNGPFKRGANELEVWFYQNKKSFDVYVQFEGIAGRHSFNFRVAERSRRE